MLILLLDVFQLISCLELQSIISDQWWTLWQSSKLV